MVDLLSAAIKEAYEYAPADVVYWDTLEIVGSSFEYNIKVVAGNRIIETAQGEFYPVDFSFTLPETESSVRGEMSISINFMPKSARVMMRDIVATRAKITVEYRQYITTGPTATPDAELPIPLRVTSIKETHTGVAITATVPDIVSAYFPRRLMTVEALPGCRL